MRLYIAEKPSLGRAIADALPQPHQRQDGFIKTGDGSIVSWCIGHMLEQAEPEAYDPAFKRWSHDHLPIIPGKWILTEKKQTRKQLAVLKKLIKQADFIVHAGDPDREGQLLVDEVIHHLGRDPIEVQRLLINDLNTTAVKTSLKNLRNNRDFVPLSTSALARSRADWLYGINLTRAYTLQGRKVNYSGVLSVGRVQTPILGLVVGRDAEIEAFVSKPFYEVKAHLSTATGATFKARWVPSDACARFLDDAGRNTSKALAENVAGRITGKTAHIVSVVRKKRRAAPPLPHSLSSLQIDAAKQYRLPAQRVLDICQTLYERHKLITYPRSDSRYLPKGHHAEAAEVTSAIFSNPGTDGFSRLQEQLDLSQKSKAWNESKVAAHHAIIPTTRQIKSLSDDEKRVYSLICRNYLAQFLADHEFAETRVELEIENGQFLTNAKEQIQEGWRQLFTSEKREAQQTQTLPKLKKGETLVTDKGEVVERQTTPPARFTDATLLGAMTGIANFVKDAALKKTLRDTDGLGTEATRAGIIELLFRRGFLVRVSKHIESTAAGRGLIEALPESATQPDRTARWENILTAITERTASYNGLMQPLIEELGQLVVESQQQVPQSLAGLGRSKTKPFGKSFNKSPNKSFNKSSGKRKKRPGKSAVKNTP